MVNTITISDVYQELKKIESNMVTKEELNSILETIEILSNEDTMEQIRKSEEDIRDGKVKRIKSVRDI